MGLLSDQDAAQVREDLEAAVSKPVKLLMFTQEHECQYCRETREILEEVASLSPHVTVEVRDFVADAELAEAHGIDKIPAFSVLTPGGDAPDISHGVRFFGIPSGYEFMSLIDAIKLVGGAGAALSQATRDKLAALTEPLHFQVFVTPT